MVPLKRVRGNQKAFMEFVRAFREHSADGAGLRVGIAHADAPERAQALVEMVRRRAAAGAGSRSSTTLGAVVGTHAGPGTVGFFWFDDRGGTHGSRAAMPPPSPERRRFGLRACGLPGG